MKHIYANLKRFDVPTALGGINRIADVDMWAERIVTLTQQTLSRYEDCEFVMFFPEAHLLNARSALDAGSPVVLGCQGLMYEDLQEGGNFGAFTSSLPAAAARSLGCQYALIGHCEERRSKQAMMLEAEASEEKAAIAVNRLLNKEIKAAVNRGLKVLYCIGEKEAELDIWQNVLGDQISIGLDGVDKSKVVIAYEPIWSIGPGKTAADRPYIRKIGQFVKRITNNMDMVYGGGLKEGNAEMLASIEEVDGGLIALTRFSGEIGFYPDEYLNIVDLYLRGKSK